MEELSNEQLYLLALNHCFDIIGPRQTKKCLDFFGSAEGIWMAPKIGLTEALGSKVGERLNQRIQSLVPHQIAEEISKADFQVLFIDDPLYPELLKHIYDPPQLLYWKGNAQIWSKLSQALAIIGTRKPTPYGEKATKTIASDLAHSNCTIVSGMALGIDAIAHQAVLEHGGNTLAVLGSGIDTPHPKRHIKLYRELCQKGIVVSEFPPGTSPRRWTFPMRNRIVSGLSKAIVVIEAGLKSGTMITVDCANEQGREVFSLPGSVFSEMSQGTHKLLQEGASLLTQADDLLQHMGWEIKKKPILGQQNPSINLTKEENAVYVLISTDSKHIDQILVGGGLDTGKATGILTILELKGMIEQLPGKYYRRLN